MDREDKDPKGLRWVISEASLGGRQIGMYKHPGVREGLALSRISGYQGISRAKVEMGQAESIQKSRQESDLWISPAVHNVGHRFDSLGSCPLSCDSVQCLDPHFSRSSVAVVESLSRV